MARANVTHRPVVPACQPRRLRRSLQISRGARCRDYTRLTAGATTAAAEAVQGALSVPQPTPTLEVHVTDDREVWAVADVHCSSFFPQAGPLASSVARFDRVLNLQLGQQLDNEKYGNYVCLAALARYERKRAQPRHVLLAMIESALLPLAQMLNAAACMLGLTTAVLSKDGSLSVVVGAVSVDALGDYLPMESVRCGNNGYCLRKRRDVAYISNLAVAQRARRQGVARRLVRECESLARSWGCRAMALHVDASNHAAVQLYIDAGFSTMAVPSDWHNWTAAGPLAHLILMVKPLAPQLPLDAGV